MQGKIADFSIPEIFQLVSSQAKSGSLAISGNDRVTIFLFADGLIVDVQPDRRDPRSLLGTMLRRRSRRALLQHQRFGVR